MIKEHNRDSVAPKPTPIFRPESNGSLKQFLNLMWFIGVVAKAAPASSVLLAIASIVRSLIIPVNLWITKYLIDAVVDVVTVGTQNSQVFVWLLFLLAGLLAQRFIGWIDPWLSGKFREVAGRELTRIIITKTPQLSLEYFEYPDYYDELHRTMSGIEERGQNTFMDVLNAIRALSSILGYASVLFVIHPVILLIIAGSNLVSIGLSAKGGQDVWQVLRSQTFERRLGDYYGSLLVDRITAKENRLYELDGFFLQRWSKLYWQARNELRRKAILIDIRQIGVNSIGIMAGVGALYWIASNPPPGASPGLYTILLEAVMGITNPIQESVSIFRRLGESSGHASDIRYFLNLPEFYNGATKKNNNEQRNVGTSNMKIKKNNILPYKQFPRPLKCGITIEDVFYTYPGSKTPAIKNLNLNIQANEKIVIVGENGSGKTTFARLLLGLFQPDAGQISVDGVNYQDIDPQSLHKSVSAVMQTYIHYNMSLADNITLSTIEKKDQKSDLYRAATQVDVDKIADSLPLGYDTMIGPEVGGIDLSGGQWQRVALARAFFRNAEFLVLDEPTANLDPLTELTIFEHFRDLAADRTALMISHRLGVGRLADRVIVFHRGTIIEEGTHDQLLKAKGKYASLFEAQARWYQ